MKSKIIKLILVSIIAAMSRDAVVTSMIVGTYIVAEVASYFAVKAVRHSYTNVLLRKGVLYKK